MSCRRPAIVALLLAVGAVTPLGLADGAATTTLGLHGIGPLKLGMTRAAALRTGWLAGRGTGCPLGGPPLPITYRLVGPSAPAGIRGVAEFDRGRLRNLSLTRGVSTTTGVVVGQSTPAQMVARYRSAGFNASARFDTTFQGTFVTVTRAGREVIGGFAAHRKLTMLAVPVIPTCD